MAQKFKFQDLKKLYGVRQQIEKGTEESENMTEEFILRNSATILQRLQKLSYLRGIRSVDKWRCNF